MTSDKQFPNLTARNIFCIPVGDLWQVNTDKVLIVYAPLCGLHMLADFHQVESLEKAACTSEGTEDILKTLKALSQKSHLPIERVHYDTGQLYQIDILANNTCNFNCIYCYSALGRSNARLCLEQITPLIDYLFDGRHNPSAPYVIHFSGGGEPLLSMDIIRQTVAYIKQAHLMGNKHPYRLGVVTNGSLLDKDIATYLIQENIEIIVSFEILENLQNKERGSYSQVAANLDALLKANIPFSIRTTFTHESVHFMCNMVEELHYRFPGIHNVAFDTVLSANLFKTPKELGLYYDDFLNAYYRARELGKQYGISVGCLAAEPLHLLRDRTCAGKFVLTPWGTLSACSRISSPKEENYEQYEYGSIQNGCIYIDEDRFAAIMHDCNIYSQSMCHDCYAKWNCGGGCRLFHQSFNEQYEKVRCDFVRKALKLNLFDVLGRSFQKSTGKNLSEFIANKIHQNEL